MRLSLVQKLILSLTAIVITVGVVAGTISLRAQERQLLRVIVLGADQLSKSITSSTWHAMLDDNRQSAYDVMRTIALKQGIDRIRIYNREGTVMFSTRSEEIGVKMARTSETCASCHATEPPRERLETTTQTRIMRGPDGIRDLTMMTPIYNEPACSNAACHAHPASQKVVGLLDLSLSLETMDQQLGQARLRVATIFGTQALLISAFIFFFTRRFVQRPIGQLILATKTVSEMNLDEPIQGTESRDELGQLARSFVIMRDRLRSAVEELNSFNQRLETRVQERTEQLRLAHKKLMQSDRLASLGQLSASVAHEINNPISGILNLSMLMQRMLKDDGVPIERLAEFRKYLGQVVSETSRVGRIVSDLLSFSRRSKPQQAPADLNTIVRSTLSLVSHKLKLSNVHVEIDLAEPLPPFQCDSSQMKQVVLNLVMNAAEATHGRENSRVAVRTSFDPAAKLLLFSVGDNGEGIPEAHLSKIFDPFFTTKPEGKGVGLGLAVLYGIVQAHGGDVTVQTKVGEGSTFTVSLPLEPAEGANSAAAAHAPASAT